MIFNRRKEALTSLFQTIPVINTSIVPDKIHIPSLEYEKLLQDSNTAETALKLVQASN